MYNCNPDSILHILLYFCYIILYEMYCLSLEDQGNPEVILCQ